MKNKGSMAVSLVLIMAMLFTSLALADQVVDDIDTTVDPALETRTITPSAYSQSNNLRRHGRHRFLVAVMRSPRGARL